METFFRALVPIAVGVVAVILVIGLWNMLRGGSSSTSQNMMRARVVAQFVAIVLIMAALWFMGR
jgi:ABC-type nickel/cobalt efflux system permease component RcnA